MSVSDWREFAKTITPGGAQTRSKRDLFPDPVEIAGGSGSQVWDSSGRVWTDWINGLCAVGLGHGHPYVNEAVWAQMAAITCAPLPTKLEVETAEALIQAVKYGEMVRWVSTGSEATGGAMLIARKATGKRQILSVGYHGWHPGHLKGEGLVEIPWGDIRKLESSLQASYVAGVLMEPMRDSTPPPGYLESVQALCRKHKALFIMDEIVTGFRWRVGGATEMFSLDPDIACFGKAMANGYRCGAIVGKRAVMEYADGVSSTYGGECVGLAAARATIRVYQTEDVVGRLWATGKALMAGMAAAGRTMTGYPVHPRFKSEDTVDETWYNIPYDIRDLSHKMATRGVLAHPAGWNPSYAHTPEDVEKAIEATSGD